MKNVKKGPAIHEFIELMNGGAELSSKIFLILFVQMPVFVYAHTHAYMCVGSHVKGMS